jgi:hypothetical protein
MKIIVRHPQGRPEFDMTPDGRFVEPPASPLAAQLFRYALIVATLAGALAIAALALWFALILIPVALGAGLIAYGAFRWRMWRARRQL